MGGGDADYRTAKTALQEVDNCPGIGLEDNFTNVFAYANKKNKEIIFTIHNGRDEYNMWNGSFRGNLVPQQAYMTSGSYFDENGVSFAETKDAELNGLIRLQIKKDFYNKVFREGDTRKAGSVKAVYVKEGEDLVYEACFPYKFQGTMLPGGSERAWLDDYPIYRYADCLLLLAEAKALLGEDITTEINTVRKRAYGEAYFEANKATLAYPNEKGGDFYSGNPFVAGDDDPIETVLKERLRELMYEGKRWYDIRTLGYTAKYSTANEKRLLWPIDANTLTNNRELVQTEGYLTSGEGEE